MTDEILTVKLVSRDGGDYCVICPHCKQVIGIEGDDISEVLGEQYQHKKRERLGSRGIRSSGCDGWLQISSDARFVKELPTTPSAGMGLGVV